MKVDKFGGIVEFERGSIEPAIDRPSFLASSLGQGAEVLMQNEPWQTLSQFEPERGVAAAVHVRWRELRMIGFWQMELAA